MSLGVNQSHSPITPLLVNPATSFEHQVRADCGDAPAKVDPSPVELLSWPQPECSQCSFPVELAKARAEQAYWREMHQKAKEREAQHQEEIAQLRAKLRLREKQLFARRSERGHNSSELTTPEPAAHPQPRGQQPGSQGHGRRNYGHLPTQVEVIDLPESELYCPLCGRPYAYSGSEDSETVEIKVKAYRRLYQRRRYQRTCTCDSWPRTFENPCSCLSQYQEPENCLISYDDGV
jgi:hypothetical protein